VNESKQKKGDYLIRAILGMITLSFFGVGPDSSFSTIITIGNNDGFPKDLYTLGIDSWTNLDNPSKKL
jgi:hypothetical protein